MPVHSDARPAKTISTPMMIGVRSASATVSIEEARTAQMAIRTIPTANRVAAAKISPDDEAASGALI
jgi:hypothetical protein